MSNEEEKMVPGLAETIRGITGDVSRFVAAEQAGGSHDTMGKLWRGESVGRAYILAFAEGYEIDPNPILSLLGYRLVHRSISEIISSVGADEEDERILVRYYRNIPSEMQPAALAAFAGMARHLKGTARVA